MLSTILLIFLPAGAANMTPPFMSKILPNFNLPMDFGLSIGGKRIFGDHKTVRGLIFGMIMAQIVYFLLLKYLPSEDFRSVPSYFGALVGLAVLMGDAIKSFFKRRQNLKPGMSWFPYDQIDWILGVIFLNTLFFPTNKYFFTLDLILLAVGLGGHLLVKWIGYTLKINDTPI